jgi:hypothetical protein
MLFYQLWHCPQSPYTCTFTPIWKQCSSRDAVNDNLETVIQYSLVRLLYICIYIQTCLPQHRSVWEMHNLKRLHIDDNSEGGCLALGRTLLTKIHREILARPALLWVPVHTRWRILKPRSWECNYEEKQTVTEFWSVVCHALDDWMWRQWCFVMVEFEMYNSMALKKILSYSTLKSWNVHVPEACLGKV